MSSETDHQLAMAILGKVLEEGTKNLCSAGLEFSRMGGGACFCCARAGEGTPDRSIVFVISGPIPDDLVQAAGQYLQGLSQDLKNDGKIRLISEA